MSLNTKGIFLFEFDKKFRGANTVMSILQQLVMVNVIVPAITNVSEPKINCASVFSKSEVLCMIVVSIRSKLYG